MSEKPINLDIAEQQPEQSEGEKRNNDAKKSVKDFFDRTDKELANTMYSLDITSKITDKMASMKAVDWGNKDQGNIKTDTVTDKKESTEKSNEYTIVKGDTLTKIAQRNGTTVDALAKLNNIKNKNLIITGQKIKLGIDAPKTNTVATPDNKTSTNPPESNPKTWTTEAKPSSTEKTAESPNPKIEQSPEQEIQNIRDKLKDTQWEFNGTKFDLGTNKVEIIKQPNGTFQLKNEALTNITNTPIIVDKDGKFQTQEVEINKSSWAKMAESLGVGVTPEIQTLLKSIKDGEKYTLVQDSKTLKAIKKA